MKLNQLSGNVHLTYCTNIHAGQSWQDIRASLDEYVPAIKSTVAQGQPMGIGLRLSGEAAAVARQPDALASFRDQLSVLGAYVFTINAFPFGPFHGVRVKEDVYLPDWRDRERVAFTANSAAVLAGILPDGIEGSISTVPGAFKPNGRSSEAVAAMARNLMMAVADLVDLKRRTGKHIALALEPEPCCFLETTDESIAFFEGALLKPETLDMLGGITGASFSVANAYLADITPPEQRAKNFGLIGAAFGLGFIFGPMLGGLLGAIDLHLPFYVAAAISALNALYGFFVVPESLPPERRSPFSLARANPFRALIALVDNALRYEKPGGRVVIRPMRTAATAEIAVIDTGAGLDPHTASELFNRFAHGDGHTAEGRHYGLGLALFGK